MKRAGRVWIRIFPDVPVTREAGRSPHGLGQGLARAVGARASSPGRIMFELDGVPDAGGARGIGARRSEAADQDAHRDANWLELRGLDEGLKTMKADEFRDMSLDQLDDQLAEAEEGAVQSALPAGFRPAREHIARAHRAPRYRAAC